MRNLKTVLIPDFMKEAGVRLLRERADLELVTYKMGIASADFRVLLPTASAVALAATPFGRAEAERSPVLEVVARIGVGFDAVDIPVLTERRIPLMVTGSANSVSVAEHAVFLMMAVAKRALEMDQRMREGRWHDRQNDLPAEMDGATVLIVGFGRIGSRTAPRCAGFGMHVLVYDPFVDPAAVRAAGCEPAPELDAALGRADYVSIHCPRNAQTTGLFDAARLARMRRGAILVNTARGGIVDEPALLAALQSGALAGAGLDVVATEPAGPGHPLLQHPKVISSPHIAGVTVQSMDAMSLATARNMLSVLDGAPIRDHVVNAEVLR